MSHKFDNMTDEQFAKMPAKEQAEYINWLKAGKAVAEANAKTAATITVKYRDPKKMFKNSKTGEEEPGSGAFSVYGLMRFPVTLYSTGWERLLSEAVRSGILAEIAKHPDAPRK